MSHKRLQACSPLEGGLVRLFSHGNLLYISRAANGIALGLLAGLLVLLAGCRMLERPAATPTRVALPSATSMLTLVPPTAIKPAPSATRIPATSQATPLRRANRFGVLTALAATTELEGFRPLQELGGGWVRINLTLDGRPSDYARLLDAGLNLVITINYADPGNIDTRYGTPKEWTRAGFPFKSKTLYQKQVRDALTPAVPYLAAGRQVWVQAENEVGDASVNPKALYWRGTVDQYLAQLDAFQEAVHALAPGMPVVLSSFASETLSAALDTRDARSPSARALITKLLTARSYDAVDLHLYGCVEDIGPKVQWVKEHLPAGKRWISTEDGGPDSRCATTPMTWKQDPRRFEEIQAQQVPARLGACADEGGSICLWFSFFDLANESNEVFTHLGLLDPRVSPPRRKPAFDAFKAFVDTR